MDLTVAIGSALALGLLGTVVGQLSDAAKKRRLDEADKVRFAMAYRHYHRAPEPRQIQFGMLMALVVCPDMPYLEVRGRELVWEDPLLKRSVSFRRNPDTDTIDMLVTDGDMPWNYANVLHAQIKRAAHWVSSKDRDLPWVP